MSFVLDKILRFLELSKNKCSQSLTNERRLEEGLWATETLVTNGDDLTVGQLVALFQGGGGGSGGHLILKVKSHVAQLLLDVAHNLTLS